MIKLWTSIKALLIKYWAYLAFAAAGAYLALRSRPKTNTTIVLPPIRESQPVEEWVDDSIKKIELEFSDLDADAVAKAFNTRAKHRE